MTDIKTLVSEELLPCPFCGGDGLVHRNREATSLWRVTCKFCDAGPSGRLTRETAVNAWNSRSLSPSREAGEAVAWIAEADLERLPRDKPRSGLVQLASMDRCDPLGYCTVPLFTTPPASSSEVSTLKAEVERMRKASEWQPIEEIDVKEGERFLAAEPDGDGWVIGIAVWCKTPHVPLYGFHFTEGDPEDWNMCKPTRWMSLPAPPALHEVEEG